MEEKEESITVGTTSAGILIQIPFNEKHFLELTLRDLAEFHAVMEYLDSDEKFAIVRFNETYEDSFEKLCDFIRNRYSFDRVNEILGVKDREARIQVGKSLANHSLKEIKS